MKIATILKVKNHEYLGLELVKLSVRVYYFKKNDRNIVIKTLSVSLLNHAKILS